MDTPIALVHSRRSSFGPLPSPPPPSRMASPEQDHNINVHNATTPDDQNDGLGDAEADGRSVCHDQVEGQQEQEEQQPDVTHVRRHWARLERFNPSLTLENSGSVARDHLASERTFLAYVRTSLTIASTGVGESDQCSLHGLTVDILFVQLLSSYSLCLRGRQAKLWTSILDHSGLLSLGSAFLLSRWASCGILRSKMRSYEECILSHVSAQFWSQLRFASSY